MHSLLFTGRNQRETKKVNEKRYAPPTATNTTFQNLQKAATMCARIIKVALASVGNIAVGNLPIARASVDRLAVAHSSFIQMGR